MGSVNPENDLQDVLENAGAGLITVNGDDNLLKNALHLLHDADYRKNMGKNAKYLLDAVFSVEAAAQQILQRVERNT